MKNVFTCIISIITKIIISMFIVAGMLTAYGAAILQESYKLHPLTEAEIMEAQTGTELLSAEQEQGK